METEVCMSIFLSDKERELFKVIGSDPVFAGHYWALYNRVMERVDSMTFSDKNTTTAFWHHVAEYQGDAAFLGAQLNDARIKNFAKRTALEIASLPEDGWIGPAFRERTYPLRGHLETAHLSVALSLTLDLCGDVFTEEEYDFCVAALKDKAIRLCMAWLKNTPHFLNNWNAILLCGVAVPAAVLGLKDEMEYCSKYLISNAGLLQSDGSYGEGLQYGNYYLWGFLLANDALVRAGYPSAPLDRAGKYLEYCHYNLLMNKPLEGWGAYPRPRCFNFDDCTAIFAPNADLLALLGCRLKEEMPEQAVMARKIFERFYSENPSQGPFDRTSFGFVPRAGWMTLLYYMQMKKDGEQPQFERTRLFKNGVAVIRTGNWSDNDLAVAVKTPAPEPLNSAGHRHRDMHSIQLFFGKERLLADPGHACYRTTARAAETSDTNHSTCIFKEQGSSPCGQKADPVRRTNADGSFGEPVKVPGRHEFLGSCGDVAAVVSEASETYGEKIKLFRRTVIVCGAHAVFVIDDVDTAAELQTAWHWCLNNRDGLLEYKIVRDESSVRTVARRGNAGLKLFTIDRENIKANNGTFGMLNDAYHPDAGAEGAGAPGTSVITGHNEKTFNSGRRKYMFAMAADFYGASEHWNLKTENPLSAELESYGQTERWHVNAEDDSKIIITDRVSGKTWQLASDDNEVWTLDVI